MRAQLLSAWVAVALVSGAGLAVGGGLMGASPAFAQAANTGTSLSAGADLSSARALLSNAVRAIVHTEDDPGETVEPVPDPPESDPPTPTVPPTSPVPDPTTAPPSSGVTPPTTTKTPPKKTTKSTKTTVKPSNPAPQASETPTPGATNSPAPTTSPRPTATPSPMGTLDQVPSSYTGETGLTTGSALGLIALGASGAGILLLGLWYFVYRRFFAERIR